MKGNALKFLLAASLALNLAVLATAGYRQYMQTRYWVSPFGKVMEKDRFLFEELALAPDQMSAMKKKAMSFRSEIDRKRQEIGTMRKDLIALMRAEKPDTKSIESTIRAISGRQEEMQRMIALHMLEIKSSLDKDQQQKFLDLIENAMTERGQAGWPSAVHH